MPDIISFNHAGAPVLSQPPKHVNHDLSPMKCPVDLDDVDLFGEGGQQHWYEAYEILHRECPVHRIEGGGLQPGTHAYVLTKHADVTRVWGEGGITLARRHPMGARPKINQPGSDWAPAQQPVVTSES